MRVASESVRAPSPLPEYKSQFQMYPVLGQGSFGMCVRIMHDNVFHVFFNTCYRLVRAYMCTYRLVRAYIYV